MKPFTFGLIIFLEIMLLDGIFAASTIKERHHILPFEDYNQEDVMQINLETDERTGKLCGADGQESHNLHTLTGKYEITEAELEDAINTFYGSEVTFNDEKTKGKP